MCFRVNSVLYVEPRFACVTSELGSAFVATEDGTDVGKHRLWCFTAIWASGSRNLVYFFSRLAPSRAVIAAEPSADIRGGAGDAEVVHASGLVKTRFSLSVRVQWFLRCSKFTGTGADRTFQSDMSWFQAFPAQLDWGCSMSPTRRLPKSSIIQECAQAGIAYDDIDHPTLNGGVPHLNPCS